MLHGMATETCPACGGAGGGPFGRPGSRWDTEDYVCPRCAGSGVVTVAAPLSDAARPGVVKAAEKVAEPGKKKSGVNAG
jgi:hypothetical protein